MPDNKRILEMNVFDGGLNSKQSPTQLPLHYAVDCRWAIFDDYGAIKNANGSSQWNSAAVSDVTIVDGLYSFKPAAMSALLVMAGGGGVHVATGTATVFAFVQSSQSLFTTHRNIEGAAFQDLLFLTNGDQQAYKFNGTEFTRAGVSAPTQNLTAVCDAAAGNLNGTYQYVFWGVNSYSAEGDYGTASTAVAITSGHVRINNIPTAPVSHGINTWKVGRNTANAQGVYWYLTDITNGTTSFTDNVADSSLVDLAPTDQGYLRRFNFIIAFAGRLWGAVEDYLWYSEINQPEEFPSENFFRIGRGDGMNISSIKGFKGAIIISKSDFAGKTAVYSLYVGDSGELSDPENWYLKFVSDYGGSESQRATVPYSNYLMMYNRDGAFAFNGDGLSSVGTVSANGKIFADTISENVETNIRPQSNRLHVTRSAAAINHKNKIWLTFDNTVASPSAETENSKTLIFDYTRISDSQRKGGAWSSLDSEVVLSNQYAIHEGYLISGSTLAGIAYIQDTGYPNASKRLIYTTPLIYGTDRDKPYHKDFRILYITASGSGSLVVNVYSPDAGVYSAGGGSVHQTTLTLTSTVTRHRIDLASINGKSMQLQFLGPYDGTASVTITKVEIVYTPRGLRNG